MEQKNINEYEKKYEFKDHPSIKGLKIIEGKNNYPISWLNQQGYCEYQIYLEYVKGIETQPTRAMTHGSQIHQELENIFNKMKTLLGREGVYVDDLFFCPHHPDKGYEGERKEYKISCNCRKPGTGMVTQAAKDFNIDLGQSWIVGDSTRDIQTGKNAGMKTILLKTGEGGKDGKYPAEPDERCADLRAAVDCILHRKE